MDELYSSLPLDKVESLEELVNIGPPGLVKVLFLTLYLFLILVVWLSSENNNCASFFFQFLVLISLFLWVGL